MRITANSPLGACFLGAVALMAIAVSPTTAAAQTGTEGEIDRLIDGSSDDSSTLATAEAQVSAGDLTGAATTLERRLIDEPDATAVRIRYAILLCELDDRQAASYELSKMAADPIDDASKAAIRSKCGDVPASANQ